MRLVEFSCKDTRLPIAWEACPCPLCNSAQHAPLLEAPDRLGGLRFLIVKCSHCGLCFTNPRPDRDSIADFYPADYACHRAKERHPAPDGARLAGLLPIHGRARLLDFGCGAGDFLQRMHALGWNVTGLDRAASAVARVHERGLPAHVGTLPYARWTEPCFEAITMWQALEHVHQPLEVLRAAHRLLTPGGRLVVAVPNFDSLASRWFGADWYGLDVPRHLTHFTPETLTRILDRAGFGAVELRQERHSSWIRHSARSGFLKTRLGSGLAGWWGWMTGRADALIACAVRA